MYRVACQIHSSTINNSFILIPILNYGLKLYKRVCSLYYLSDKCLEGTVVNQVCPVLNGGLFNAKVWSSKDLAYEV